MKLAKKLTGALDSVTTKLEMMMMMSVFKCLPLCCLFACSLSDFETCCVLLYSESSYILTTVLSLNHLTHGLALLVLCPSIKSPLVKEELAFGIIGGDRMHDFLSELSKNLLKYLNRSFKKTKTSSRYVSRVTTWGSQTPTSSEPQNRIHNMQSHAAVHYNSSVLSIMF